MLTETQLRTAKTIELERLKSRVEAELKERREQEEQQRKQREEPGAKDRLILSSKDGHYQWEYRQCGHKERCKRCKSGTSTPPPRLVLRCNAGRMLTSSFAAWRARSRAAPREALAVRREAARHRVVPSDLGPSRRLGKVFGPSRQCQLS